MRAAFRQAYEFMQAGARAHAKWDYEVSMNIIRCRKRLLILGLVALPAILVTVAHATGMDMLGGKMAFAPSFYSTDIFIISIFIGLIAGLITGCIGAGGGFIITPALMAAGIKGILAVGTDLFHIFAKAIMGTVVHKKLGNVSGRLAAAFLVGSIIGATVGGWINMALFRANPLLSEMFISTIYAVLLGFLGFYALNDFLKSTRGAAGSGGDAHGGPSGVTGIAVKLQSLNLPP